jgi:hypothetical protein
LQDGARTDRKIALVAGAPEAIVLSFVVHSAGKVRAFLTVGDVLVRSQPHKNAGIVFSWILKQLHLADGDVIRTRHGTEGIKRLLEKPGLRQNPKVTHEHAKAGEH